MTVTPKPSEFQQKLVQIGVYGFVSGAIALGRKLGLFRALAKVASEKSPASPAEIAEEAKCKERYVKEWLCMMATADIIEVNEEEKFWIKPENVKDLAEDNVAVMFSSYLPCFLKGFSNLANVFQLDGPLGLDYEEFEDFHETMDSFSELMHRKQLVSQFLPRLADDLIARLEAGGVQVLDVGCGNGFHSALLAETFPNSTFTAVDISHHAIKAAQHKKKSDGSSFDNLTYLQMDAGHMNETWTEKFDLVLIFDACHDQMRPDLCLKEVYRVMKPGAIFGMLETNGSSNVHKDKKILGYMSTILYGCSMYHCLPVGNNSKDALGLGAAWGNKVARKLLESSGFTHIDILETPESTFNQLYVCKK